MHFSRISCLATFAATVSAYGPGQRTFAVNHFYGKGNLVTARMDPIISPGTISGHVHAVQGGNAFSISMTDDQALNSTCTSSLVKADKSNYWTPALYFKDPTTGSLESVDMFYMNVYYFFEGTTDKIEAFPPGLRMVIGNPSLRSPPATGGLTIIDLADGVPQPVQWTCPRTNTNNPLYPVDSDGLHGSGIQDPGNAGAGVGFPDQNCDGYASPLRADVHFPSCYNPAAGLENYEENMEFPTNSNCPTGWIHTPHLFYEVYWNTPAFADRWTPNEGTQPFVLANGDPTGYGLHGDFFAGWDVTALQQIIDNCDAGDSGMDKCPGLEGGLNDASTSCNLASPFSEVVTGVMSALPGNNPIGQWGVSAVAASIASASAASSTAKASSVKTSSTPVASSVKAVSDPVVSSTTKTSASNVKTSGVVQTVSVATTPKTTAAGVGATTMITSIVHQTTVILTTVTPTSSGTQATGTAVSGGDSIGAGWSYKGCYADTSSRVLTGIKFANVGNHQVSNTKCAAYCDAAGYTVAGTEYGGQCFCDNAINASTLSASSCDMACEGNSAQTCGGNMALSVYTKSTTKKERRVHNHMHRHVKNIIG